LAEPFFRRAVRLHGVALMELNRWLETRLVNADLQVELLQAPGDVDIVLKSKEKAFADAAVLVVEKTWGRYIDIKPEERVETVVGKYLLLGRQRIALAESCTGGRIAARLTSLPGSSRYFDSACVCYSNTAKERFLSVPSLLIEEKGAVSREVAIAMAEGVRIGAGVDLGLSVTGIAGPGGGSEEKPVGLVYIALSDAGQTRAWEYRLGGEREAIQAAAAQCALEGLRLYLGDKIEALNKIEGK